MTNLENLTNIPLTLEKIARARSVKGKTNKMRKIQNAFMIPSNKCYFNGFSSQLGFWYPNRNDITYNYTAVYKL